MKQPIAVQLYCFNKQFSDGFPAIFKQIHEIGFEAVELCGGYTLSSEELASALRCSELKLVSWHFGIDEFINDYDKAAAYHKALGNHDIVIPWYKLDSDEELFSLAEKINALLPKLTRDGFYLSYHNHNHEFLKTSDGRYLLEALAEMCPGLYLEPDVYWIAVGGEDPAAFIRKHADRIRLIHLKNGHGSDQFDSLDKGIVDIPAVLAAAKENQLDRFIVENDNPQPDPKTNLGQSLAFLKTVL